MSVAKAFVRIVDKINEWIGRTIGYSALILMLFVVYEVISRRFFNKPTLWAFESILMIFGFHLMLVSGYGLLKGSIVSVDILSSRYQEKTQKILQVVTYLVFFFPFVTLTFISSIKFASVAWITKECSWSVWAPPLYPIKTVIPVAFFLILIQGISEFVKAVYFLIKGENISK